VSLSILKNSYIMPMLKLQEKAKYVKLSVGDMIIDLMTGNVGILIHRQHRVDMVRDDIYIWEIVWNSMEGEPYDVPNTRHMEELGLKLSIVAGMYDWHRIKNSLLTI